MDDGNCQNTTNTKLSIPLRSIESLKTFHPFYQLHSTYPTDPFSKSSSFHLLLTRSFDIITLEPGIFLVFRCVHQALEGKSRDLHAARFPSVSGTPCWRRFAHERGHVRRRKDGTGLFLSSSVTGGGLSRRATGEWEGNRPVSGGETKHNAARISSFSAATRGFQPYTIGDKRSWNLRFYD